MPRFALHFIALLLLSPALVACGAGRETAPIGGSPRPGPVTIDLWHSETAANLETLESMVARFNASQDQVRVQPVYQGNEEEIMAKLVIALPSRQVPAVLILEKEVAQEMIDTGAVRPVQDFIDRDGYDLSDLDENALRCYTVGDKLRAVPFSMNIPLLYYNKVVFREAGLDAERPPQDLEELRQYAEKIVRRDESGQVVRGGIAIDIRPWVERILAEHGDPLVDNDNGYKGRATRVLFNNDTGRWVFQWWDGMVEGGLAINVGRNLNFVEGFLAMASGRAAMTFSYANALRSVVDALEEGVEGVEIGVGRLPGVPGGTGASHLLGRGLWVLSVRPEEEQEASWKFVQWLIQPEQQTEWFAGSGNLPVSRSAIDLPAAQDVLARYPLFQTALDLYRATPNDVAALGALLGAYRDIYEVMLQAEEEMVTGAKDPVRALEDATNRSNQIIEEYNRQLGE